MLLYALSTQESSAVAERTRHAEPGASVVVVCGRRDILSLVSIVSALIQSGQPRFLICIEPLVEGDGLALVRQAKRLSATPKTLLICNDPDSRFSREIVHAHCDGILGISSAEAGTVLQALTAVLSGGPQQRDPAVTTGSGNGCGFSAPQQDHQLTAREQQVLQLIVQGHSNREISETLHLGLSTVKTHVGQLLDKMGARDRTQAAVQALALGLVPWPSPTHGGALKGTDTHVVDRERATGRNLGNLTSELSNHHQRR